MPVVKQRNKYSEKICFLLKVHSSVLSIWICNFKEPQHLSWFVFCLLSEITAFFIFLTLNTLSGWKHQSKSVCSLYFNDINNTTSFLWDEGKINIFCYLSSCITLTFYTFKQLMPHIVKWVFNTWVLKAWCCSVRENMYNNIQSNRCREYLICARTHSSMHRVTEPHNACTLTHNKTPRVNVYRFYPSQLGRKWTQQSGLLDVTDLLAVPTRIGRSWDSQLCLTSAKAAL